MELNPDDINESLRTIRKFRKKLRQIERLEALERELTEEEEAKVCNDSYDILLRAYNITYINDYMYFFIIYCVFFRDVEKFLNLSIMACSLFKNEDYSRKRLPKPF